MDKSINSLPNGTILENKGKEYEIVELLGKGGYGFVYKAIPKQYGSPCAIKEIYISSDSDRETVKKEARILSKPIHDDIPKFIDKFTKPANTNGQPSERYYLVMEFIGGKDFGTILKEKKEKKEPFQLNEILKWVDDILDVLEALHSHTIYHRDIKPANLKLSPPNRIKILDLGIAKDNSDLKSEESQSQSIAAATTSYAPIEQLLKARFDLYQVVKASFEKEALEFSALKTDARSDIYALGITIYSFLTNGLCDLTDKNAAYRLVSTLNNKPDPIELVHKLNPKVPLKVSDFIQKAIEIYPEKRFQSATEMRLALKTLSTEIETNLLESKVRESLIGGYKKKNGLQNAQTEILRIPEVEQIKQSASLEILQKIDALRTKLKNIVGYLAGISWLSFLQTWAFWRSLFYYVGLSILWLSIVNLIANYFSAGSIFLSLQETYLKFTAHLILTSILGIITSIIMRSNLRQSLKTILFSTHFIFLVLVSCKFGSLNTRYLFYFTSSILSLAALVLGMINKKSLFHFGFNISIYLWLILLMECFFNLNELVFMGLFLFVSVVNLGIGLFGAFNRYQNSIMPTKAKWATGFLVILVVSFLGIIPIRYALGQKTTSNTPTNANIFVVNSNKVSNITNTNVANAKVTPTLTPKATPSTSPTVEKNVTPTPLNKEEKENLVAEKKENETNEFIRKIALETVFNKYYTKCDKNYIYLIKFESSHRIGFKNYNTTHQLFVWDENSWYVRLADGSISSKNLTLSVDLKEVESTYWWLKNETPVRVRWEYLANVNYNLKVINSNSKWILDPSDSDFKERVAIHEPISCDEYTKMISFKKIVQ
jgi:serine/threonine protein kinase